MRRRYITIVLMIFILSATIPLTARSDMIAPPPDNVFYLRNRSVCFSLNRGFYANGEEGMIYARTEPGARTGFAEINNGEIVFITHVCRYEGELWGMIDMIASDKTASGITFGWVLMDQLLMAYDYISFRRDHESECHRFSGSTDALVEAEEVVFWKWPGSGKYHRIVGPPYKEQWFDRYFDPNTSIISYLIPYAYEDHDGREWAFISEYMKYGGNVWVCVSDPSNADIPAFNAEPEPMPWQPAESHMIWTLSEARPISESQVTQSSPADQTGELREGLSLPALIIILVAALAIATTVLIRIFWKKKTDTSI